MVGSGWCSVKIESGEVACEHVGHGPMVFDLRSKASRVAFGLSPAFARTVRPRPPAPHSSPKFFAALRSCAVGSDNRCASRVVLKATCGWDSLGYTPGARGPFHILLSHNSRKNAPGTLHVTCIFASRLSVLAVDSPASPKLKMRVKLDNILTSL